MLRLLETEVKPGERLPTQETLSLRCRVSRTTVHRILESFIQSKLISRSPFLLLRHPRKSDYLPEPETLTQREAVEKRLIKMLMEGEFPPGSHFSELALARQYGVTTGTVREALLSLSKLGVFTKQQRHQWKMVVIDSKMINELIDLRILLECFSLQSLFKATPKKKIAQQFQPIRTETAHLSRQAKPDRYIFFQLDRKLHETILTGANNRYLLDCSRQIQFPIQLQAIHQDYSAKHLKLGLEQHLLILDAILDYDARLAEKFLRDHLEGARATLLELIAPSIPSQ